MAASSPKIIEHREYLYASNANVSDFVSVKLLGKHNYRRWKTQMLCLMEAHNMDSLINDPPVGGPPVGGPPVGGAPVGEAQALRERIRKQYQSLLRGWLFGSLSDGVLDTVADLGSAKDVWDKLKSLYDHVQPEEDPKEIESKSKPEISEDIEAGEGPSSKAGETMTEEEKEARTARKRELRKATWDLNWLKIKEILEKDRNALKEPLYRETGDTLLHIAVEMGQDDLVEKLLLFIQEKDVKDILEQRNGDGNTVLHVAVSVGNKHVMKLLVDKHKDLLTVPDKNSKDPLIKAFNNMQYDTFVYLFKAAVDNKKADGLVFTKDAKTGASLLVNAITAKQYSTALELIKQFSSFAKQNNETLMAIARNFPSELNYWERLIYPPTLKDRLDMGYWLFHSSVSWWMAWRKSLWTMRGHHHLVLRVPVFMYFWVCGLIRFLIWIVFFPLRLPYLLLWKVLARLVPPIKHIEKKNKVLEEADMVLDLVCDQIEMMHIKNKNKGLEEADTVLDLVRDEIEVKDGDIKSWYKKPILEASIHNADRVFMTILDKSPEAIESKHKNGYHIFQLAVINRSEKIYNLLYFIGEDKNRYRTLEDSFENNMLHLAGRLAPSHVLKRRTGAALQLQRELQWFMELKKFMHPSAITKQNIFGETPQQVFTREHENLVKEGEKWMKTTAESCSISAALITTIVFAAAITVPGGSNPETGIPMFRKDIAFTIFAISDAISLFTSSSSLMVFLSILTARFAEQDFLFSLPKRLIIGLCTLLLSITTMMVAFGATLYLLFSRENPWMLGPICGFAFLPILFFVTLQFPLIADLYRSTYVPIFD